MNSTYFFPIMLSLKVSIVSSIMVVASGVLIAYILARKQFKWKEMFDVLLTLPMVLPPTVTGYYLIVIFGRNGIIGSLIYEMTGWTVMFTWQAAVLASYVVSLPLMIKTARAAIEEVDENLVNASYTLGRSELETALKIILPLSRRGIMAGAVLSFARGIGEFGATLMLAGNIPGKTNTMPIAIYSFASSGEWGKGHIMVIFLTIFSGAILYLANRYSRKI
ncbi:molybdate ABC transporter permease subunit [Desulforegula conservatrix]|uniref:molybdate ABC transporter permease subunit n=1 Tax=Desulforegula conservatrix TaxID=153026 RepID=UPI000410CACB|nr:molybdate ABC transporter permease subunit [Desulforegula conservatrix]